MTISECYSYMGENFDAVLGRLMKADRIEKYFKRMFEEGYYEKLVAACESKDVEAIFIASHDLKGLSLNLGLSRLAQTSSDLCEAVRGGVVKGDIDALLTEVKEAYSLTYEAYEKFVK